MSGQDSGARLRELLARLQRGELALDDAVRALSPVADLAFAQVDHDRAHRCGYPEVVYCPGKTATDAARIAAEIVRRADAVLLTRADPQHFEAVRQALPDAVHHQRARCVTVDRRAGARQGLVAVVAAGTADLPVAEEAAITAEMGGAVVERHFDVGVAGLHRLLDRLPAIRAANAVVAVAGMEGALPSVLAGQVGRPVVAVPTSVGYGAAFGGIAALLAMLNACAAGVAVVNIDNGFGAGYLASQINRLAAPERD